MKASGADIQRFWEEWPPGDDWFLDDYDATIRIDPDGDGEFGLDLEQTYELLDMGPISYQGSAAQAPQETCIAFEAWFKKWKKNNAGTVALVVTLPKEDVPDLRSFAGMHRGWQISKPK